MKAPLLPKPVLLLIALVMLVAGGSIAASSKTGSLPAGMMSGIAILYALLAGLHIYPALKLWKFLGIMVIAIFVPYLVIVIAVVAFGGFAAIKAQGA